MKKSKIDWNEGGKLACEFLNKRLEVHMEITQEILEQVYADSFLGGFNKELIAELLNPYGTHQYILTWGPAGATSYSGSSGIKTW